MIENLHVLLLHVMIFIAVLEHDNVSRMEILGGSPFIVVDIAHHSPPSRIMHQLCKRKPWRVETPKRAVITKKARIFFAKAMPMQ